MIHALAHTVTAVGAGWGRSQEWLSCARVLWDWLHNARSNTAAQGDDGVACTKRRTLQDLRLCGDLEQSGRVGRFGRLHTA